MKRLLPYAAGEINDLLNKVWDFLDKLKDLWKYANDKFELMMIDLKLGDFPVRYSEEILLGIVILVLLIVVLVIWKIRNTKPKRKIPSGKLTPKEARKAAKLAKKMGNQVRSGELYEQAGDFNKAIKMYLEGRAITRAANVYFRKLTNPDKALKLLLDNNLHDPAAQIYSEMGQSLEAARHFVQAGKENSAAEEFEKAGQFKEAGELYLKYDRLAEAGRCFSRAGDNKGAGEVYVKLYKEYKQATARKSGDAEIKKLQDLAKRAAFALKEDSQFSRAGEVLLDAGLRSVAAEMFALAGDYSRAAELYNTEREFQKAAEYFHKAGDSRRAAEIMANWLQQQGRGDEAAKYLAMAGDYLAAADIAAGKGDYVRAAQLFMKGGDSRTASEMYIAAGRSDEAIKIFESVGDIDGAIRMCEETGNTEALAGLYERAKRYYEAAGAYMEMGRQDKAVQNFERITPDHPYYGQAQYRLGEIKMEKGECEGALKNLQAMAGRVGLSPDTLDQYYLLGLAYEKCDYLQYALGIYHQVAAYNMNYKDIMMRYNEVGQKLQSQQKAHDATRPGGSGWGGAGGTLGQRYKVTKELGRGGMGVVYLAEDTHLGRKVAIKVLPEEFKRDRLMVNNFIREATSLAQLSHPYIVSIFDAGEDQGVYYIIMEYVEGKDFKELMGKEKRRLPISAGVQVFSQLSQALDYAHNLKVIHRDIKPANIMWTANKIIKVMDFGLARVMDKMMEGRTQIAGTPYYMSPEQTMGKNIDHRSDIYSAGVTMYELMTGEVPFQDGDIGYHHMHTPPIPPSQKNNQIGPELDRIIMKCMAKDPNQRYQKAGQIFDELDRGPARKG